MSKTVTLRLNESVYKRFRDLAEDDNRPLSKLIETAALRFIEEQNMLMNSKWQKLGVIQA